jgi:dipeptidyl aminopeptidase/acylaminoacyl peptidase
MRMRRLRMALAVGVVSYVASGFTPTTIAQTRRTLQPDDIFELKSVGDPRISPDGAWVAYTVSSLDRKEDSSDTDIYMAAAAGGAPVKLTSSKKPETSPRWSPDGRYLAFLSSRDGKKAQAYLLDRRGGDAQVLTASKTGVSSIAWSPDGTKLAMLVSDPDPNDPDPEPDPAAVTAAPATPGGPAPPDPDTKKPKPHVIDRLQFMSDGDGYLNDVKRHLHLFDIAAKTDTPLTSGKYDDGEPVWSPDGKLMAFSANRTENPDANDNTDIFVIEPRAGAEPRAITSSPSGDHSPVFSPDGASIAYVTGGDPKDIWYAVDQLAIAPVTGGAPRMLTPALDRNVAKPAFTADGSAILFLIEEGGNRHVARVPAAGGSIVRVLDGERDVSAFDLARTGDLAVLDSQPQMPPEIFLLSASAAAAAGATPARLTHVNDAFLATITLGAVERFKAKSADGTMIDAFLTRPPGAAAGQKLPAILRIHGGPVSQFSTEFELEWQMLAAHGFAVIAANPRGSSGYGRAFSRAIFADWGNKDFEDVMAAVDTAVAMGVADPARLGVGGWSYGGILTDHVISKTTRFKAAISGASEFNYLANYGTDQYQRVWEAELGLPWQNPQLWMKLSPFYRLDKITTPTLVLGGDADMNVPILGGEQLYQGLKRLGRETELVIYPGETHAIRRPSFQKDRFERYIAWYGKYLMGGNIKTSASVVSRQSSVFSRKSSVGSHSHQSSVIRRVAGGTSIGGGV